MQLGRDIITEVHEDMDEYPPTPEKGAFLDRKLLFYI
jgi:hypothetical protein